MADPISKTSPADLSQVETVSGADRRAEMGRGDVQALRRDDFDRDVWCLLGLPVDVADIDQTAAALDSAVRTGQRMSFVTLNVNYLVRAMHHPAVRAEILNTDFSVMDGAPLVALAKRLSGPSPSRVAGSDLFELLRRRPGFSGRKIKVFFFGGDDDAAERAVQAVNKENGGIEGVGALNPGRGDVESMSTDAVIDEINAAEPDFVMVALGGAKGQAWIERNRDRLNAPITSHLGAVVNFTSERIARAPKWVQDFGLEWAWRIKEEPVLWKRYANDAAALAKVIAFQAIPQLGRGKNPNGSSAVQADLENTGAQVVIKLSGDIGRGKLAPVREAFRQAAEIIKNNRNRRVCIDFSSVNSFDRSFMGQILMLEKHCNIADARLVMRGASAPHEALLRANKFQIDTGVSAAGATLVEDFPAQRASL